MKKILLLTIISTFIVLFTSAQTQKSASKTLIDKTPKEAVITINFLDLPGAEIAKSKWEVSYELRMIDRKSSTEATLAGKLKQMSMDGEKIGILIDKGSFIKKDLSKITNRQVVLKIPLDKKIQEKLKNTEKLQQEFLFYGSALVYDAKLKKNILIPLSWAWHSELYPDAKFGMEFKITENKSDGGYSYTRNTFLPDTLPKGFLITTTSPVEKNQ